MSRRVYRGPNYWSYEPAINLTVELGSLEDWPSDRISGFTDRLLEMLPGLTEHNCSRGHPGGFVERLREGTWTGHVAEHIALALQRLTGADIGRGKTRGTGTVGQYYVIYGFADERVGLAAGELAVRIVNHLVEPDPTFDFTAELEQLIRMSNRSAFGPSTQAIIDEAVSRDIPYLRLNGESLVQLGQGVHQRRIRATMTSGTSSLAVELAGDKQLTNRLLASAGLPVPKSGTCRTEDEAWEVARRIGLPVVLKPLDGNHGRGVVVHLNTEAEVRAAFHIAARQAKRGTVVVETFASGKDYRALVVGGAIVAIAERVPAHVVGDGSSTVAELVEEANRDPRRGIGHENILTRITVNEAAIELARSQGWEMGSVPPEGTTVQLALTANLSTGGISIDRTNEAHPDNVEIAEQAAQVIGLDVAGIDFVATDISRPVRDNGGVIIEVNAAPGFRMHTHPTIGEPQYVAKPVVDLLFPPGAPSRIPIIGITGTNGKTTTARMVAHILKTNGRKVGMTSSDGVVIDQRLVMRADAAGPKSARMVLQNPRVDCAVFEVARGGILREGLGYEHNDVAVVLNVAPDHLGVGGIENVRQLAALKRVVVEAVRRDGFAVLNADDPLVARMARACSGEVVYFTLAEVNPLVEKHCRRGGRAVVLEDGPDGEVMVVRHGPRRLELTRADLLPATYRGLARMNIQNGLAAAGAAYAFGVPLNDIRQGLRTFQPSFELAPGRLNMAEVGGSRVVMDYAHNAAGMRALGEFVDGLLSRSDGAKRPRAVGVIGTAGDRRDQDLRELGEVAAQHFDVVFVREDARLRGRAPGEAAALVADGARASSENGGRCQAVHVVHSELDAVRAAMAETQPGEVAVLCVDDHAAVWDLLRSEDLGTPVGG
ncbi:MAG TPA: cyanophycin synthetase [Acidimicrobiales bacterium]|nr:cyanophycin synthetase [Acidimicrobiales bacterium]